MSKSDRAASAAEPPRRRAYKQRQELVEKFCSRSINELLNFKLFRLWDKWPNQKIRVPQTKVERKKLH